MYNTKGEYDLITNLREITSTLMLVEPWGTSDDPDFHELNKKEEFILHYLHKITPQYILEEYIEMPDGTTILEPPSLNQIMLIILEFGSRTISS